MNERDFINSQIKAAEESIETAEALKRLESNADFQKIILKGYFVNYAAQMLANRANVELQSADSQRYIERQTDSVAFLQHYFNLMKAEAVNALDFVSSAKEELIRMDAEEGL